MSDTATLTYETACTRIEEVIRRLDSGEAGLRETLEVACALDLLGARGGACLALEHQRRRGRVAPRGRHAAAPARAQLAALLVQSRAVARDVVGRRAREPGQRAGALDDRQP